MLYIDFRNSKPIYEQIADRIEEMTIQGIYKTDEQLPSIRQLAMELSINPNTIQKAYSELENRNIIYSVKGRGIFISGNHEELKNKKILEFKNQVLSITKSAQNLGITKKQIISWIEEEKED